MPPGSHGALRWTCRPYLRLSATSLFLPLLSGVPLVIIPDEDASELSFWTGVAERMIQTMSSYTSEGVMFAVDTRLLGLALVPALAIVFWPSRSTQEFS